MSWAQNTDPQKAIVLSYAAVGALCGTAGFVAGLAVGVTLF